MEKIHEKISHIVGSNPKLNATLFKLGIHFYNYSEQTLEEVCKNKGLSPELVEQRLNEGIKKDSSEAVDLSIFPVELVVEYLKHSHYLFIKDRIPYLWDLINNPALPNTDLINDLRVVFPDFIRDFIQHIYDEEDSLFAYIYFLNKGLRRDADPDAIQKYMREHPMSKYEEDHFKQEDEMQGIRDLTANYQMDNQTNVHLKVLMDSLKSFDEELVSHAGIENEILFPKAKVLEAQVAALFPEKI